MLIGDVSRRTGVPASTLRYYEDEGLLPRPARASGRRVFDDRTLAQIAVVRLAKHAGFALLGNPSALERVRRKPLAPPGRASKGAELEAAAEPLAAMQLLLEKRLRCRSPDIEFCGPAASEDQGL